MPEYIEENDLISRKELGKYLADLQLTNRGWHDKFCDFLDDMMDIVDNFDAIPVADVGSHLPVRSVLDDSHRESAPPVVHGKPIYRNRPIHYEHYEMVEQTENGEPLYRRQRCTLQDNPTQYCPECGKRLCSRFTNYCPNCGAKMDLEVCENENT